MPCSDDLSAPELSGLRAIPNRFVSADYWEDETVQRYRALGLVWSDGDQIHISEAGRLACANQNLGEG